MLCILWRSNSCGCTNRSGSFSSIDVSPFLVSLQFIACIHTRARERASTLYVQDRIRGSFGRREEHQAFCPLFGILISHPKIIFPLSFGRSVPGRVIIVSLRGQPSRQSFLADFLARCNHAACDAAFTHCDHCEIVTRGQNSVATLEAV